MILDKSYKTIYIYNIDTVSQLCTTEVYTICTKYCPIQWPLHKYLVYTVHSVQTIVFIAVW